MTTKESLLEDFGTWVDAVEADEFLCKLGLEVMSLHTDYASLQKITEAVITQLPFHNLFLLTRPPAPPSCEEIRQDMLEMKGGPCGTMNPFLGTLLRMKGFDVELVSASMMEPDCHLGLLVTLNNYRYYVDAGDGKPYFEPMNTGIPERRMYPSHVFRHFSDGEELVIQYAEGNGTWTTTCTVDLTPRKFKYFAPSISKHYTLEDYGPFSRNLRLVKYPGRKIIGFRNFTMLREESGICIREKVQSVEQLKELTHHYFGNDGLPIEHAIDILVTKRALTNG